jgi:hypothetical protein
LRQLETGNLQKIDELWRDLSVPANETEAALFNKYVEQFGFADESQRVEESRKQLREAHLLLRQRNLQAQRDAKSEAERIRRDYERQQRESEQRSQDEVLRRNRESAGLKKQMLEQVGQCILAISAVAAGEPDSRTKMEDALQQAKIFRESLLESGAEVQVFADVVNGLPQHINELKQVFARFSALSEKDGVSFNMNRRQRLYVVKIASGQLVCRNNQEQTVIVDIFSQSPEVRRSFFRSLMNNTEIRNAEFYFYLFNRKLPPVKSAPGKFWRKCLTLQ